MPFGLITGLIAAFAWGSLDIFTALASRRVGSLRVTAGMQLVGAGLLLALAIGTGTTLPTDPRTLVTAGLLGIIGAGAYLSYFTGLRIGPITVVSGMVAAYGGLTVVLSVVLRGEHLNGLQAAGAAVATIGVLLTGIAFGGGFRATRFAGPGVIFAVIALVLFAGMAITTDVALETGDWLQVLVIARAVTAVLSVIVVAWLRRRDRSRADTAPRASLTPAAKRQVILFVALAGILDVIGLTAFAIGLEKAPTWMVGLASSFGPAVTIVVAVVALGERLKPIQWFGLSGVAVGMILIGLP
jgi:drug/metabolite transporter (DMT)-like permease